MLLEHSNFGGVSSAPIGKTERCRPDYEHMIKTANTKLEKCRNLKNALFDYIGNDTVTGRVAEMVGELVSEERVLLARIEQLLIDQQGADHD